MNNRKSLLAQKARIRWLREGDVNSKVFHKAINHRRISNGLIGLQIGEVWTEEPEVVKNEIKNYLCSLYSCREQVMVSLPFDLCSSRLDDADGEMLTSCFSEEEIKLAIWDCESTKSPGPDGFGLDFFKDYWEIFRVDLLRVFSEFHANGKLAKGSNSSFITLIPKKAGVCTLNDFRPISLISSLYKVLTKVLARRMKKVIGKLIGDAQSAFIKGRCILDGVVVLNEAVEEARKSKKKWVFFKVDFRKALIR